MLQHISVDLRKILYVILFVSPKTSVKYFINKIIAIKMMISLMASVHI